MMLKVFFASLLSSSAGEGIDISYEQDVIEASSDLDVVSLLQERITQRLVHRSIDLSSSEDIEKSLGNKNKQQRKANKSSNQDVEKSVGKRRRPQRPKSSTQVEGDVEKFVLIVDAGSSGSRLRIFQLTPGPTRDSQLHQVKVAEEDDDSFETEPGLSDYSGRIAEAGPSLAGLLTAAAKYVPAASRSSAKLYIKATAGMRLLPAAESAAVFDSVRSYMSKKENCPFHFMSAEVVSGQAEGFFGYIGANHHLGNLASVGGPRVGVLDLGGASTQIAFKSPMDIRAHQFQFYNEGKRQSIYDTSYMRFGQDQVVLRSKETLAKADSNAERLDHPCLNRGYEEVTEVLGKNVTFVGSGDATRCSVIVKNLLHTDYECLMPPCAIMGRHMPAMHGDFQAFAAFFYAANGLGLVGWSESKVIQPQQIRTAAESYCALSIEEAVTQSGSKLKYAKNYCTSGMLIHHLLAAYGFADDSSSITFSRKVNGHNMGWTLGAALYETTALPMTKYEPGCSSQ